MKRKPYRSKRNKWVILRSSAILALGIFLLVTAYMVESGKVLLPAPGDKGSSTTDGQGTDPSAWNLTLVNGSCFVPEDFTVDLAKVEGDYSVDKRIVEDAKAMLQGARDAGLKPILRSAYRNQSTQTYLYKRKIQQYVDKGYSKTNAATAAARWVAPPGTSEHQLGLAVDIVGSDYQVLDEKQENTAEQKWLMEHCWEYGFILRYPSDKSDITGISYEPWHYRYVGRDIAKEITEQGVCLEEYLESLEE